MGAKPVATPITSLRQRYCYIDFPSLNGCAENRGTSQSLAEERKSPTKAPKAVETVAKYARIRYNASSPRHALCEEAGHCQARTRFLQVPEEWEIRPGVPEILNINSGCREYLTAGTWAVDPQLRLRSQPCGLVVASNPP